MIGYRAIKNGKKVHNQNKNTNQKNSELDEVHKILSYNIFFITIKIWNKFSCSLGRYIDPQINLSCL